MITLKINNTRLCFTDIKSLVYDIKTKDVNKDFSKDREINYFSNYSAKSKYYDNSNKLVDGKIKVETAGVAIEEYFGWKLKRNLILVDDTSEHKKEKCVNKNIVTTIRHSEYKGASLNNHCFRQLINRIHIKNHKIGT